MFEKINACCCVVSSFLQQSEHQKARFLVKASKLNPRWIIQRQLPNLLFLPGFTYSLLLNPALSIAE